MSQALHRDSPTMHFSNSFADDFAGIGSAGKRRSKAIALFPPWETISKIKSWENWQVGLVIVVPIQTAVGKQVGRRIYRKDLLASGSVLISRRQQSVALVMMRRWIRKSARQSKTASGSASRAVDWLIETPQNTQKSFCWTGDLALSFEQKPSSKRRSSRRGSANQGLSFLKRIPLSPGCPSPPALQHFLAAIWREPGLNVSWDPLRNSPGGL